MTIAYTASGHPILGTDLVTMDALALQLGHNVHRVKLLTGLGSAINILQAAGCRRVYIGGGLVTNDLVPRDYSAVWETAGVDMVVLREMEPVFFSFSPGRAAQKLKFFGEFFPVASANTGAGKAFLDYLRVDLVSGNAKGIFALDL